MGQKPILILTLEFMLALIMMIMRLIFGVTGAIEINVFLPSVNESSTTSINTGSRSEYTLRVFEVN